MLFLRRYFSYIILGALVLISIGVWGAVFAETPRGVLTVAVLDIGQGDSIFIESPTGVQVIVDGGPHSSLLAQLPAVMPLADRSIDALIETHPDADHFAGFIDVIKRYNVGAFIEPGITKHNITTDTVEREVSDEKIPEYLARRGMWLDLGGGAELDILFPDFDPSNLPPNKEHEGAIVARLVYGNTSVLLMGDAPMDVEDHLMAIGSSTELVSTILKVGHHGSRFSTGDAFLSEVHPSVAIISVGAHNTYGHPTQEVLHRLINHNIKTLRTDQEGTIEFQSDGETFVRTK